MAAVVSTNQTSAPPKSVKVPPSNDEKMIKRKPDPLPYVIVFAILFLIFLGLLTWFLDVYHKQTDCGYTSNPWCSDNWICANPCNGDTSTCTQPPGSFTPGVAQQNVNSCFCQPYATGGTGLASCLYGVDAPGATTCLTPSGTDICECPTDGNTLNCLGGCAASISDAMAKGLQCCCNPASFPDGSPEQSYCQTQQTQFCNPVNS